MDSIKCGEFINHFGNYQLPMEDCGTETVTGLEQVSSLVFVLITDMKTYVAVFWNVRTF
jgi:hypothetical protein